LYIKLDQRANLTLRKIAEKLAFECKKRNAKNLTFKKKAKKSFFPNKLPLVIFLMTIYGIFFFGCLFLAIFLHSNGNFPEGQVQTYLQVL